MAVALAGPTLVLATLAGLVVLTTAVLGPPIDGRTVRSLLPWMVTAGLLRAIAPLVPSDGVVATLFTPPGPTLMTVVLLGVALLGAIAITRFLGKGDSAPFVAEWGIGVLLVVFVYVLYRAVSVPLDRLVSAVTALLVLSVLALVVYALLFRLAPAVVPVADLTGIAAVWGHALAVPIGLARSPAPHELFVRAATKLPSGLDLAPVWLALAGRLVGVALVLLLVVRLVESGRNKRPGYLLLAVLAGSGLVPGVASVIAPIVT
jgi:uncharacterized membrane protein